MVINVVIPMSGRGQRFKNCGYDTPKPFIPVHGLPMFMSVVRNLNIKDHVNYIFLCLKEHAEEVMLNIKNADIPGIVIPVETVTEGAACTVLLAKEYINNDDELLIANCDQLVLDADYMNQSLAYFRKKHVDGGILCFLNDSPKWSYVKLNGERIIEVVEKQVISNIATVGIYYWSKGKDFVSSAEDMINKNIRVQNEYYVCPTYNLMIINNKKIIPYIINEMFGIGTPEDYELYQKIVNEDLQY